MRIVAFAVAALLLAACGTRPVAPPPGADAPDHPQADAAAAARAGDVIRALGQTPAAVAYRAGPAPTTLLFAEPGGLSAQATVDAGERTVLSKRLFAADGSELATVTYQRWKEFDELKRATVAALAFPGDPTEIGVT